MAKFAQSQDPLGELSVVLKASSDHGNRDNDGSCNIVQSGTYGIDLVQVLCGAVCQILQSQAKLLKGCTFLKLSKCMKWNNKKKRSRHKSGSFNLCMMFIGAFALSQSGYVKLKLVLISCFSVHVTSDTWN